MALFRMKSGVGAHSMRLDGKVHVLRPGDEVECDESALRGGRDKFVCIDSGPVVDAPELPVSHLRLVGRGGGWYDVYNERSGGNLNDAPLRRSDAFALVNDVARKEAEQQEEDARRLAEEQEREQAHGDGKGDESTTGEATGEEATAPVDGT